MIDPRERFSSAADKYHRFRPSYPAALVDWILAEAQIGPGARVVDLGCGTGISTRLLASRGLDVVGVDPNDEMLGYARSAGGARYVKGESAATGLPPRAFDLVAAAQAFHWFELQTTLAEIGRMLRPGGWCAAFWNLRGEGAFMDAYDAALKAHSSEYQLLEKPRLTIAALRGQPANTNFREAEFPNAQRLDREGLFGRAYSSSYVIHALKDPEAFDAALDALFERFQQAGEVEFPYRAVALMWQLRGS